MENSSQTFDDAYVRTFRTYYSMIERTCIQQDSRWYSMPIHLPWVESFRQFVEDVGLRPKGHTLDRIDNDGGYVPGNVRWATPQEQCRNRSNTLRVDYRGEERILIELCEDLRADYEIVRATEWLDDL
jgi:hypothetical protein